MSSSRSWLEGTMEVISGTVGRSSTPTPPYRPSLSAPSSPCPRSPGGSYGIQRLPSQDTLDRSIHNDSSHGKSSAQIIKDLRASNAALTAKTAEMEADFMNQVNKVTMKYEYQNKDLHEALKNKDKKIATLESRTLSTENRIRDRDGQLSKLKEENAFQRQSIADLKTQLYQLQSEIEDGEYEDGDDWVSEKREMLREVESLKRQVSDLKASARSGEQGQEVLQSWKQLEEVQAMHTETKARLEEAQSALALAENVSKRKHKEHEEEILILRAKHAAASSDWADKERELRSQLEALESDDIELTKDLRAQVEEQERMITDLQGDVRRYSTLARDLKIAVAEAKASAENQDRYRREEAEDLRILNDAQEEENRRLQETIDELKAGIDRDFDDDEEDGGGRAAKLVLDLTESREAYHALEREIDEVKAANEELVAELREEITDLQDEKEKAAEEYEERLSALEDKLKEAEQQSRSVGDDSETQKEKIREVELKAEEERAALEKDFNQQKEDWDLEKQAEIVTLRTKLEEAQENAQVSPEVDGLNEKLEQAETALKDKETRLAEVEQALKEAESKVSNAFKAKHQLREAQIALVALDDAKKKSEEKHREQMEAMEKEKSSMESELRAQLDEKETLLKNQTPKNAGQVSELAEQVVQLREKMMEREAALEKTKALLASKSLENGHGGASEEQLEALRNEKDYVEKELSEKLNDRDMTITALLKSSVLQERKVAALQEEMEAMRERALPSGDELMGGGEMNGGEQTSEIKHLRQALDEYKTVEETLSRLIDELKAELEEVKRSRGVNGTSNGHGKEDYRGKLQERDEAISTLVKESLAHEAEISALKRVIKRLEKSSGPSWEELERLQKESEIFAGQIIEQDEEMENLKTKISEQEREIHTLTYELKRNPQGSGGGMKQIMDLQAELDEVREANDTHCQELRELRKELRLKQTAADRAEDLQIELYQTQRALEQRDQREGTSFRESVGLRQQLDDALASKEEQAEKMAQQMESIRRLRNSAVESLEAQVKERDATIQELNESLSQLKNEVSDTQKKQLDMEAEIQMKTVDAATEEKMNKLQLTVGRLRMELEEKELMAEDAQLAVMELRRALDERTTPEVVFQEKESLTRETNELRAELANLEEDKARLAELKEQLAAAQDDRESWERGMVESYERKISLLKLDKDVTIDGLRKELAELRAKETFDQEDLINEIQALEAHTKDLEDELEAKLQHKDTKVEALQQALMSQEQLIDNMRSEMDQLQSTMERANVTRRAEIEEMQQEAFESSAKATQFEREAKNLKIKLDETEALLKAENQRLADKIASLETPDESPTTEAPNNNNTKSINEQQKEEYDDRLENLKERLEKLQWRNTSLQNENEKLRERLDKAENLSSGSKDEKKKSISSLEHEVSSLNKKIKDMELDTKMTTVNHQGVEVLQVVTPSPRKEQINGNKQQQRSARRVQSQSPSARRPTPSASPRLRFLKRKGQSSTKESSNAAAELKQTMKKGVPPPPPLPKKDSSVSSSTKR